MRNVKPGMLEWKNKNSEMQRAVIITDRASLSALHHDACKQQQGQQDVAVLFRGAVWFGVNVKLLYSAHFNFLFSGSRLRYRHCFLLTVTRIQIHLI